MNSHIAYQVTSARVADMHRQAERDQIVREARQTRRAQPRPATRATSRPGDVLHRLLSALAVG